MQAVKEELERTRKAAEEARDAALQGRDAALGAAVNAEAARVAVLDLQREMQRLNALHLANAVEVRGLFEQVLRQLDQAGMRQGEARPSASCSIRGEDERRAVRALLARFRSRSSGRCRLCSTAWASSNWGQGTSPGR